MNENIKREILDMVEVDQKMRRGSEWNSDIDKKNTEQLKEIIKQYGWPTDTLVGAEAAKGAWLLAQHADHDLEFQKQALSLLESAVEQSEAEKSMLAFLTDRVRVNSGKPQIYGTQFFVDSSGKYGPRPIENMEGLEERRKEFGLESFSTYQERMNKSMKDFNKC